MGRAFATVLARLAGAEPDDVVWDPFCGSGLELIERTLLGGVSRIFGTDLSEEAVVIAGQNLAAAVAETPDGEDGFDLLPVVLIANSGEYIDLVHGIKVSMSHSAARAGRHNFFAAVVKYDNGDFVFSAPRTEAKVNKSTLVRHYGTAIVSF